MENNQSEKPKRGGKREGAGRKKTTCKTYCFNAPDGTVQILEKVPQKTAFIIAAVEEKAKREGLI